MACKGTGGGQEGTEDKKRVTAHLLRLEVEEEGGRPILLAVAEAAGGILEDLRGEMEPGPLTAGFILLEEHRAAKLRSGPATLPASFDLYP